MKTKLTTKQRADADAWLKLQATWDKKYGKPSGRRTSNPLPTLCIPDDRNPRNLPSVDSGIGNGLKKSSVTYTGTNMLGIATMHKSNSVPIFKKEEAVDIASMRR